MRRNRGEKSIQDINEKHNISLATQKFILQMCWAQHDSQWFLKSKHEIGIKKANELNQKVIHSMGRIEAKHIMNALGIRKGTIKSIPEAMKLMNTFMDLIIPIIMKFTFVAHSEIMGDGIVKKCFIWEEVKKSKKENEYECSCMFRHRGWLDAMGIDGDELALKRFCDGDDECVFRFTMKKKEIQEIF